MTCGPGLGTLWYFLFRKAAASADVSLNHSPLASGPFTPLTLRRHAKHGPEGLVAINADASRLTGIARSHFSMRGNMLRPRPKHIETVPHYKAEYLFIHLKTLSR
jgi:hypothetical protein